MNPHCNFRQSPIRQADYAIISFKVQTTGSPLVSRYTPLGHLHSLSSFILLLYYRVWYGLLANTYILVTFYKKYGFGRYRLLGMNISIVNNIMLRKKISLYYTLYITLLYTSSVAYPGGFLVARTPPPTAMIFLMRGTTPLLAPTFTSLFWKPPLRPTLDTPLQLVTRLFSVSLVGPMQ